MRVLFLFLLLALPALAQSPESTVRRVYSEFLKSGDERKVVANNEDCFTPGLLQVIDRHNRACEGVGEYGCFLIIGNGGWGDYEIGAASVDGKTAIVPIVLYCGLRSEKVRTDPKIRRDWPKVHANVVLVDIGRGYQISDIQFAKFKQHAAFSARRSMLRASEAMEKFTREHPRKR